jgi:hypothetical protein
MPSPLLLILGAAALSLALRSFHHPLMQKLGALAIIATSFLTGWLLTGYIIAGVLCAASWLLLPWLEILTRIRRLRLPLEKALRHKSPPSPDVFPALDELTSEIEKEGFRNVEDAGWDWEDYQQFFRLFYKDDDRSQATICLIDQSDIAFYYLSISSRAQDGKIWTTWNYPFSHSLKLLPQLKINRVRSDQSFFQLCESHRAFLQSHHVATDQLEPLNPEEIQLEIQQDLRKQIAHNLAKGVLTPAGEGRIRYSWRGLFFIWWQFLCDLVRFS